MLAEPPHSGVAPEEAIVAPINTTHGQRALADIAVAECVNRIRGILMMLALPM